MIAEMSFQERNAWIFGAVAVVAYLAYVALILGRARSVPLEEVAWVLPMIGSIGAAIVASILVSILASALWGRDCGRSDERDRQVHRFGEYVGSFFVILGGAAAIVLSMAQASHFWIANAVYLCFALSTLLGSAAKIVAYRTGVPT